MRQTLVQIESADQRLLASVKGSMDEALRRSGSWIACRPGCAECCLGPFPITQLDAWRLHKGMSALRSIDPDRASRIGTRAAEYVARTAGIFTGDVSDLSDEMDSLACPVLDPEERTCDLYEFRPMTCRTFGPATRTEDDTVSACELCYAGASEEAISDCAIDVDQEGLEREMLTNFSPEMTIVAYALTAAEPRTRG